MSALGFVVVNRAMGAALWRLEESRCGSRPRVCGMQLVDGRQRIDATSVRRAVRRSKRSWRLPPTALNPRCAKPRHRCATWNYEQTALVTNVLTQRFHDHVAYERFTPSGPLALLPMSEGGWA